MSDLKIIDEIYQTLDVSLISSLSEISYLKLTLPFLEKYKKEGINGFKNKPLSSLLYNYLTYTLKGITPFNFPTYIMGPSMLVKLTSEKYNKTLYMFGESHTNYEPSEYKCLKDSMEIAEFIKNIITYSDKPIDFYLETAPLDKYTDDNNVVKPLYESAKRDLHKLRSLVYDCISANKKDCIYHTTRSHYFDIRQTNLFPYIGLEYASTNSYKNPSIKSLKVQELPIFIDIIKKSIPITSQLQSNNHINIINKQIKQIDNTGIKRMINNQLDLFNYKRHSSTNALFKGVFDMLLEHMVDLGYIKVSQYSPSVKDYYEPNQISSIFYIKNLFNMILILYNKNKDDKNLPILSSVLLLNSLSYSAEVGLVLTDLYTLGRMFRTFKQVKNQNSIEPRNIIYYAGSAHTTNLIKILIEELRFKKEEFPTTLAEPKDNKYPWCIDISSLNGKLF